MLEMILGDQYSMKDRSIVIVQSEIGFAVAVSLVSDGTNMAGNPEEVKADAQAKLGALEQKLQQEINYQSFFGVVNFTAALKSAVAESQDLGRYDVFLWSGNELQGADIPGTQALAEAALLEHQHLYRRFAECERAFKWKDLRGKVGELAWQIERFPAADSAEGEIADARYRLAYLGRLLSNDYDTIARYALDAVEKSSMLGKNGVDASQVRTAMLKWAQELCYAKRNNDASQITTLTEALNRYNGRLDAKLKERLGDNCAPPDN